MLISVLCYKPALPEFLVYLGHINSFLLIPQTCHLKRTFFSSHANRKISFWGNFYIGRVIYQEKFISINNEILRRKAFVLFMVGKHQMCNECSEK